MKRLAQFCGAWAAIAVLVTACAEPAHRPHGMGMGGQGAVGGMGMGRMEMGPDNTPAWPMMSAQEREAHRTRMRGMQTEAECHAYLDEHHRQMSERAKANGQTLNEPRHDMCAMAMQRSTVKP